MGLHGMQGSRCVCTPCCPVSLAHAVSLTGIVPEKSCAELLETPEYVNHSSGVRCQCLLDVDLTEGFGNDDTFIYYALDEFYQVLQRWLFARDGCLTTIVAKQLARRLWRQ